MSQEGRREDEDLHHLATPSGGDWVRRVHGSGADDDPRNSFERDKDRILYSESFRRLAHKTQVFIVTESDRFSTRILHSLEAAQIGRSLASSLGLNAHLAEAICLGHDVGHTPFGHIGEKTIEGLLGEVLAWNSNEHSLRVLDQLEIQYPGFRGLDLTWATREGIGRHKTPFDEPGAPLLSDLGLDEYPSPSLETQVSDVADQVSYLTHDIHDALEYGVVTIADFDELGLDLWQRLWKVTEAEYDLEHPGGWAGVPSDLIKYRRLHRHMIGRLVDDVLRETRTRAAEVGSLDEARQLHHPIVAFSDDTQKEVTAMISFLYEKVYKSPLVARQNAKARRILRCLFKCLTEDSLLLPFHVRERIHESDRPADQALRIETAFFLGELTDRAAIDLYRELYSPDDRAMGHHVS
ncbi:MAG TPA: dNTP triphosphohydrolase [Coriobacteriia bacterium]|nr:dNTP triphosphohydrolase [Coriobacteriia bacterium]